jgi:hypothetical protein
MTDSELSIPQTGAKTGAAIPRRRTRLWPWIALALALLAVLPFATALAYRWAPPPASMLMAIRWVQGSAVDYRWRPLEAISPHLAYAVATARTRASASTAASTGKP